MSNLKSNDFKNILIVRTDRIGDVVLTTPAMKALRMKYVKTRITVLVAPATKDLIVDNPYVDEVIVDDRQNRHKGLAGFFRLVSEIKKARYDLAIVFHTKKRTNLLCYLAGIRHRLGYKNDKYGFLLNDPVLDDRPLGKKHEVDYCLDLIKVLGADFDGRDLYVSVLEREKAWVSQLFAQNNIGSDERVCLIHPGASDPSKMWSYRRFAELINILKDQYGCKIILVGVHSIRYVSRKILNLTESYVMDLTGLTTVAQLAALIGKSQLLVSNDSGPVHIAAALQTPVVSIFTRNQPGINPERWKPLGSRSRYIAIPPNCDISFEKAGEIDLPFSEQIKTAQVLEAVDSLFKLC